MSAAARKIRVLHADDSAVMRSLLRMALAPRPEVEIVGTAANGEEAVAAFDRLHPDLVLLDVEMPGMNGLEALSMIRRRDRRVPILMCSTLTSRGAHITIEALVRGATDYVTKPSAQKGLREGIETLSRELLPKILALFAQRPPSPAVAQAAIHAPGEASERNHQPPKVIVIGVSTGGPAALETLLSKMPAAFPLPILIVQHMPRLFTGMLAERLDSLSPLHVREAAPGARPVPGTVDIARGDWHLELTRDFSLRLHQNEPENFCRPAVDVLFRSAAQAAAGRLLGVVLTGMGSDGLAGSRAIRAAGGTIFAQDSGSSVVWGMPGAVTNAGLASKVLPLEFLAAEIQRFVFGPRMQVAEEAAL